MTDFVIPDPSKPLLLDISKWQNDISTPQYPNFDTMKQRGVLGVIMKAGQAGWIDRDFLVNWENAKKAGMPRGSYWFYDNKVDPKIQAQKYLSVYPESGELGLWLDLESRIDGPYRGWRNWYNFITYVQQMLPRAKIGIYTGHYYWREFTKLSGIPAQSLQWFKQFPLWIAAYGGEPLPTEPWGNDWLIWQFTDLLDGKSYGVESNELDGNYFSGTKEEYYEYFGLTESTDTPGGGEEPEETMTAKYNCVARFDVKVRDTPDTLNVSNSKIYKGTSFQVSELVPDRLDPTNSNKIWGKIFGGQYDGKYTALVYPGNDNPISTYTEIPVDNGGGGAVTLTHTIEVYSDGSLKIDGIPY